MVSTLARLETRMRRAKRRDRFSSTTGRWCPFKRFCQDFWDLRCFWWLRFYTNGIQFELSIHELFLNPVSKGKAISLQTLGLAFSVVILGSWRSKCLIMLSCGIKYVTMKNEWNVQHSFPPIRNYFNIWLSPPGVTWLNTHPHSKHAWAFREGTLVLEKLKVDFANVVLQVESCGEVGLAVVPGTRQHRFMRSMNPFVPPQSIHLLKHLLTRSASICDWNTIGKSTTHKGWGGKTPQKTKRFYNMTRIYLPGCLAMCFPSFPQVCSSTWQSAWGQR